MMLLSLQSSQNWCCYCTNTKINWICHWLFSILALSLHIIHHSIRILNANPMMLFLLQSSQNWCCYFTNTKFNWICHWLPVPYLKKRILKDKIFKNPYPYPWIMYPYPYPGPNPSKPVPVHHGYGYWRVRVRMT